MARPIEKTSDIGEAATAGRRARRRVRLWLIGGLIAFNALACALSLDSLLRSRQHYEQRAESLTRNVANAVDLSISKSIERVDLALRSTTDELERQLAENGRIDEQKMNLFLMRQMDRLPEVEAFRVADASGLVFLGKGVNKQEKASWADREYFTFLKEHPEGGLQISKPRVGRVARQMIVGFARRYNSPEGRFAGVVSAPIALSHFTSLLGQFNLGPWGAIILRDADLAMMTRVPPLSGPAGEVGNTGFSAELRDLYQSGKTSATYYTPAGADRVPRILSYRRLSEAPMVVLVGIAKEDYLADWYRDVVRTLALLACFVVVSLVIGAVLLRLLKLSERQERELVRYRDHLEEQVKERTAALSIAKEAAESASRAKTVFLATMSHELRTPMNGIMGLTGLAMKQATDERQKAQLVRVMQCADRLLAIIGDILDYTKMAAERLDLESAAFSLHGVLDEQIAGKFDLAAAKGLRVERDFDPRLEEQPLVGDRKHFGMVISHLLDNAVKFTSAGSVTVRSRVIAETAKDVQFRVDVQDTGIGIRPEDQKRLFGAFEQIDGSISRHFGGLGLGLALSRQLIVAMGGSIAVQSEPGQGSTFSVTLRLVKAGTGAASASQAA